MDDRHSEIVTGLGTPAPDRVVHNARDEPAADGTIEPLREAAREAKAPHWLAAYRTRIFAFLAVLALLIFGGLTALVTGGLTSDTDVTITRTVQSLTIPWVAALMVGVSWIGFPPQAPLLVIGVAALFWLAGYRVEAGFAVAAAASTILTETIKHLVSRPRPGSDLVEVISSASGHSFPSGHVLFYVTFFGFLAYVAYALLKRGLLRKTLLWTFGLLIVLIGPSRIWMGQHWASDALASYTLGFAYLVMLIEIYSRFRFKRAAVAQVTG
jgi:membrane-associated phospholipid phosphatase